MSTALLVSILLGYLLGSIPFGVIVTRAAGAGDLRKIGSGNIGTTNVLRTGRKELAALTLLGDMLKATVAVLVARHFFGDIPALAAGAAAFLGHVFPIWLRFKGGKGVATYLGALIGAAWPVGLAFAAVWIAVAWLTRYSSASALAASIVAPVLLALFVGLVPALVFAALTLALWALHHENIARLMAGEESRIGQKSTAAETGS
ncbi:glycerol-3-phosphate 1-O-acyltransferase PlsY [Hansschlegelia zhihuaiae]|uniref:Glycerol-3-phosphate acyltransferase n=1 Tax=Hansschlegelia zhihuaiae TaxID=405005 RepID=A0A4Q0MLG4_9HYPH|nr:glycerol-3-phosphate 1-O-acyltransferase PlsY [Hansschlegelia zhihuaiae]RXF74647.1 glycerol-3-phosphate 1-O-acyltransferase PlsY [Hansschlegelia zhihuaiae]